MANKCPYCNYDPKKGHGKMIYGLIEDSDEETWSHHRKDLYLAGCVPDGYAVEIKDKLYLPKKRCNTCGRFFDYDDWDVAMKNDF